MAQPVELTDKTEVAPARPAAPVAQPVELTDKTDVAPARPRPREKGGYADAVFIRLSGPPNPLNLTE